MQIVSSNKLPSKASEEESLWIYNGLDCAVTLNALPVMAQQENEFSRISYNFVSGMRAPALEIMLRGIRVDMEQRQKFIESFSKDSIQLKLILDQFANAVWDKGLNPASPKQMKEFLYETMGLPEQYKSAKGEKKVSTDRDALEKLSFYFHAQPIVNTVLAIRELDKRLAFLRTGIDKDFRLRTSYNVVGTESGRWSSSENPYGMGTNNQNIEDELRRICISDAGRKLGYFDKDQAESRAVAYISGDLAYIQACNSGDLHTTVCRMVWPKLGWTGDLAKDKEIAEQPFYRHFSYRDMAKRGGHGTNYYGTPFTMAKHLKVEPKLMENFQAEYFRAFPGIKAWHHRVAQQIQTKGYLITALGRKRNFLGRRFDDSTLREAIAFEPQSIVGELLNLFLYRVWRSNLPVEILGQIHDAILVQYPKELEDAVVPKIIALGKTEVYFPCGTMIIPVSAATGWNWAKYKPDNTNGMKKYKPNDNRTEPTYGGILDWAVS